MVQEDVKYNKLVEVINGWKIRDFILPIEDIARDLYTVYNYEELQELEFEYLASKVAKVLGFDGSDKYLKVLDNSFFPKLDCILAVAKNPYEMLDDVIAFVNAILVCNDAPICGEDIVEVSPHFIERGLYALNKILPPDMDLHDVFWSANIQRYLFTCYGNDSFYMLPRMIEHLEPDMFNAVLKSDDIRNTMKTTVNALRELAHGIVAEIKDSTGKIVVALKSGSTDTIVDEILDIIEKNDGMSEPDKLMLMKYMRSYIYKRFYRNLLPEFDDFK